MHLMYTFAYTQPLELAGSLQKKTEKNTIHFIEILSQMESTLFSE